MNDQLILLPLGFNYVYDTPSDHEYPLNNTISNDPNLSEGWSSVRYCSFPQVLIIKFIEVVSLRQIKLLFHQYKIPKRVDVFFYKPTSFSHFNQDFRLIPFERLGHVIPNSNDVNRNKLRELKSIKINIQCLYLKLQLQECYNNELNIFNQVGVIRVECFGQGIGKNSSNQLSLNESDQHRIRPSNDIIDLLIKDSDYDDLSKRKILALKDRFYIETNPALKRIMAISLDELRVDAKKILKLKQLQMNYIHLKNKEKANEIQKNIIEIQKIIEGYNLPQVSFNDEMEVDSKNQREEKSDIVNVNTNKVDKPIRNQENLINNSENSENEYQYSHDDDDNAQETSYNQRLSSQIILQKFLQKKKLIQESHLNSKDIITRGNIVNESMLNL